MSERRVVETDDEREARLRRSRARVAKYREWLDGDRGQHTEPPISLADVAAMPWPQNELLALRWFGIRDAFPEPESSLL
jgi:hypothetical protein